MFFSISRVRIRFAAFCFRTRLNRDLSPLILDMVHSCHSGRFVNRYSAGTTVELLANAIAASFSTSLDHTLHKEQPRSAPPRLPLSDTRWQRKGASRSLNREGANRAWVFEVKYFKYTLFAAFLLPHRRARLRVLNLRVVATLAVAGRVRNVDSRPPLSGERSSTGVALGLPPHFPLANPLFAG
jgi:hypothetical protein